MYCPHCYKNNAFEGHDVNYRRAVLCCPDCRCVSYPMPELADLKRDVEQIAEQIKGIENMPELEE